MLEENAFDLLAFLDPTLKQRIIGLFQFSHVFISCIHVTCEDEHLFSHKRDVDQESLGQQPLSESKMIESKRRHQTYNNRTHGSAKAKATVCSFA